MVKNGKDVQYKGMTKATLWMSKNIVKHGYAMMTVC